MSYINKNYWEEFYKNNKGLNDASTFSKFISTKIEQSNSNRLLVDLGCGTGKDSFYFAKNNIDVLAIDGSKEVIKINNAKVDTTINNKINFLCVDLSNKEEVNKLMTNINSQVLLNGKDLIFYTRFFLHAIPEEVEDILFDSIKKNIKIPFQFVAEFRTKEDELLNKTYKDHYRRYIDTDIFIKKLLNLGFTINEFSKGRGLSVYKNEDPYLARLFIEKK